MSLLTMAHAFFYLFEKQKKFFAPLESKTLYFNYLRNSKQNHPLRPAVKESLHLLHVSAQALSTPACLYVHTYSIKAC